MCNRFRSMSNAEEIAQRYKAFVKINFPDNPNVAPTDEVPIIALDQERGRKARLARFGLVPRWSKTLKQGLSMTNARIETVTEKPAFREAYRKRRCIIPADGYYEWREEDGLKQPYLFTMADHSPMALAGLWEWAKIDNQDVWSFTILTNEPNSLAQPIHDRMPCIVAEDKIEQWLDPEKGGLEQLTLFPSELMSVRRVNRAMNSPRMKDRHAIDSSSVE